MPVRTTLVKGAQAFREGSSPSTAAKQEMSRQYLSPGPQYNLNGDECRWNYLVEGSTPSGAVSDRNVAQLVE